MLGINGWELPLLIIIAVFVLGPDRLPEYAAKLARGIRKLRVMAEGAKDQLRDQLGPEYDDIDWRQYDPRQYDPRRIVREALMEPLDEAVGPVRDEISSVRDAARFAGTGADGAVSTNGASAGAASSNGASATSTGAASSTGAAAAAGAGAAVATAQPRTRSVDDVEAGQVRAWSGPQTFDPTRPTPYDVEAT